MKAGRSATLGTCRLATAFVKRFPSRSRRALGSEEASTLHSDRHSRASLPGSLAQIIDASNTSERDWWRQAGINVRFSHHRSRPRDPLQIASARSMFQPDDGTTASTITAVMSVTVPSALRLSAT